MGFIYLNIILIWSQYAYKILFNLKNFIAQGMLMVMLKI
jgi:hypothetical protein